MRPKDTRTGRCNCLPTRWSDGVCREHLLDAQKNELKPWTKKEWCIPKVSGEFVARMEDVLDLYHQDYDPDHPVVCFDETSKQLVADRDRPSGPGRVEWNDMTTSTSETGPETHVL